MQTNDQKLNYAYTDLLTVELDGYISSDDWHYMGGEPVATITYELRDGNTLSYRYMATPYRDMIADTLAKLGLEGDDWLGAYETICEKLDLEPYEDEEE